MAGLLSAPWGVGSLIGGVAAARWGSARTPGGLALLIAAMAAGHGLLIVTATPQIVANSVLQHLCGPSQGIGWG